MDVTKKNLRNKLFDDAILDSHNTEIGVYSPNPSIACKGYKCYGMLLETLVLLDNFNLITSKQLNKITSLDSNYEVLSKYLKKIK